MNNDASDYISASNDVNDDTCDYVGANDDASDR
jgi:hypothetical protein